MWINDHEGLLYCTDVAETEERISKCKDVHELEAQPLLKDIVELLYKQCQQIPNIWKTSNGGYVLYLFEVKYVDAESLNKAMEHAPKRRGFFWISCDSLLNNQLPLPLFNRVKGVSNLHQIIQEIRDSTKNKISGHLSLQNTDS